MSDGYRKSLFAVDRLALWLLLRVPSGAGWRYSRVRIVRAAGDWWLPHWYGLGVSLEDQLRDVMQKAYDEQLQEALRRGELDKR